MKILPFIKKDLSANIINFVSISLLALFLIAFDTSNIACYLFVVSFLAFYLFYSDSQRRVDQFLVSLPVSRKRLVLSRYIVMIGYTLLVLVCHILIDSFFHVFESALYTPRLDSLTVALIIMFISLLIAITVPIYYIFRSYIVAGTICFIVLLFTMMVSFGIINSIDVHQKLRDLFIPAQIPLILIAMLSLYVSYTLSSFVFKRKDL
ncbi:MAG TPA: ABC-2 transporter permease [Bacillota bacterium]|nr:ABC-2 transporter permease [Bacillota bacterium]